MHNAVFVVEPSRGKCVPKAFLGQYRPDFWGSDRYGAQLGWAAKENQVCLAPLIRDVQYGIDQGDSILTPGLRICSRPSVLPSLDPAARANPIGG